MSRIHPPKKLVPIFQPWCECCKVPGRGSHNVLRLPNLRLGAEGAQAASVTGRGLGRRAAQPPGAGKRFSYVK